MRILLVIDQYDNDNNGTTISTKRFADALRRRGNEVRAVSTGKETEDKYVVDELYIPIFNNLIEKQGMCIAKPNGGTLRSAIKWAEIVHFLMPFPLAIRGRQIAEEMGVPYTAAFHVQPENISYNFGLGETQGFNDGIYKLFHLFYKNFSHIHCPSEFIASELRRSGYKAKLHVVSNGIENDFEYRKIPKHSSVAAQYIIVMIGRLSNEKRQDVLIDAVSKSKYSDKIQLVLAGNGPNYEKYTSLSKRLKNPVIIGFFDKQSLKDLLAMSDLYVHAADAEIEAISCIEAFSCGLVPVISNSVKSATPQFALDRRSLFVSGDSGDLSEKIDYWLDNEEERKIMEKRYAEYGKNFNIDYCINSIEQMFSEAIQERNFNTGVFAETGESIYECD